MKNEPNSKLVTLFFVLTILVSGCGQFGEKTPSDVIKRAYMDANSGDYSKADSHFPSDWVELRKLTGGVMAEEMKKVWDSKTRNKTIQRIEILEQEVNSISAQVRFRLHFKDGKTEDDWSELIKEEGQWKIRP